ncbi:MAG: hypothetical protein GXY83_30520 [Rhodopirellula sp.]|nr:hypothetical protein [Rhodopirellula sp.]
MATEKGSGVFFRIGPNAGWNVQPGRRPIRKKTPDPLAPRFADIAVRDEGW